MNEIITLETARQQVGKAKETASALVIQTQEDLTKATDVLKRIKDVAKILKQAKDAELGPLNEQVKAIREHYATPESDLSEAEGIIKDKMVAYQLEAQRKQQEQEKKLLERVERGTMKPETAMKKLEAQPEVKKTVAASTASVTFREDKVVVIVDEAAIPRKYLVPDMVAINKDAKNGVEIAGVKVEVKKVPVIR